MNLSVFVKRTKDVPGSIIPIRKDSKCDAGKRNK